MWVKNRVTKQQFTRVLFLVKDTIKKEKESPFVIASNPWVFFHPTNEKKKEGYGF